MLLCHIRDHDTVIGKTTAVFCRDKYQGTTGNLCHIHTIAETEMSFKEADNDNETAEDMENHTHTHTNGANNKTNNEIRLQDIIRTSTLEIIKGPEDIERLLENGALTILEEIQDITKQAETVINVGPANDDLGQASTCE